MDWIRLSVKTKSDPAIERMAAHCRVRLSEIVGCVANLLGELPEHARDGDLSGIPDGSLERWAVWEGKRGLFAAAFRLEMCAGQQVKAWEKHNGAAIRDSDSARERSRINRQKKRQEAQQFAERSANEPRTEPVTSGERSLRRDGTGRDVVNNNNNSIPDAAVASPAVDLGSVHQPRPRAAKPPRSKPEPGGRWPAFTAEHCQRLHQLWKSRLGGVDFGRFRKAFGEVYATPEPDRPTGAPTNGELDEALEDWLLSISRGPSSAFGTPEKCAAQLAAVARSSRNWGENFVGRLSAVDTVVHGRPLGKAS